MRMFVSYGLVVCLLGVTVPQAEKPRPDFRDYAVKETYKGKPAPPILTKGYRTRIREGAKHQVQFAGHYTIPAFGCGSGCSAFYVVDSISGKVYDGLGAVVDLPDAWREKYDPDMLRTEFHPDSRLLKINGCPDETNCGFYDYIMVDSVGLKLVRKELLPKEFQY